MTWNPYEHSDEDNNTWSLLRAIEWGRWPIFVSQPLAPILLLFLSLQAVVGSTILLNVLWAAAVRYRVVSVGAAFWGALFVRLKWITCPAVAAFLYFSGEREKAVIALLWPPLCPLIGALPTAETGRIQRMFMKELGYERLS